MHLASPVKKKKEGPRIIADDFSPNTNSHSNYDIPQRKHVIQIDVPTSTKKIIEHTIDPRLQLTPDLKNKFHGTKFLEVKSKPTPEVKKAALPKNQAKPKEHHELTKKVVHSTSAEEVLHAAQDIERRAEKLSKGINVYNLFLNIKVSSPDKLSIKMMMKNKEEKPSLRLSTKKDKH